MSAASAPHVRTIVGISGGVDSSVAAMLLRDAGEPIAGLFMQNWADDGSGDCRAETDRRDAVAVCGRLGIPIHFRDFSSEYWAGVFSHFLAEYAAGRTPNPDVLCNREIKFKHFLDAARELGAQFIATGHYARVVPLGAGHALLRAVDRSKDQSYFLHQLGQEQLASTKFPLGELAKTRVRTMAQAVGLPTATKKDSTGICFIGERDFRAFLKRYLPAQPGAMRTLAGADKGRHEGALYYTIGQRQGLGIGGAGEAWYVVDKDIEKNVLYVEQGEHHPALYNPALLASQLHWVAGAPPSLPHACSAKVRYRQTDQPCTIGKLAAGAAQVTFATPQRAVTPGQSVVFYEGEACLGGGVIDRRLMEEPMSDRIPA